MAEFHEYIIPLKEIDGNISPKTERDLNVIMESLKCRRYSMQNLIEAFNGYSKCVKLETVEKRNYREVRSWLLKNLALVLNGQNICPFYDVFDNVEDIMEEYSILISGLKKLQDWCTFPYIKIRKFDKIMDYLKQFLMVECFLKIQTKSMHDIISFINDDIATQQTEEDEADTIDSIEQNMKKWEIINNPPPDYY
ncbi:MAG: hypothetical protein WD512_17600 [Candidatus Paceibacterota bacterium]